MEALRALVKQRLKGLEAAGVQQLPAPSSHVAWSLGAVPPSPSEAASTEASSAPLPERGPAPPTPSSAPTTPLSSGPVSTAPSSADAPRGGDAVVRAATPADAAKASDLRELQQLVIACTRCHELASTRKQTVFGVGNPHARLCLLGEAPGADEDRMGEPFVGRAGQLLNKILEACRLRREDVYILNVLKCRPPGNRNPTEQEAVACRPFLDRQLDLIGPEFICCLGAVAAQNLLGVQTPIGRLRGTAHDYRGLQVICTYHPAYLLRNPSAKRHAWDDMKLLMRLMGTPVE
ncbi:MAG: uracil-DNA glycosylase [Planctomycetales bacterium]|nr:uracil-DNA glycosylase [Planctomycetales bacterium]